MQVHLPSVSDVPKVCHNFFKFPLTYMYFSLCKKITNFAFNENPMDGKLNKLVLLIYNCYSHCFIDIKVVIF